MASRVVDAQVILDRNICSICNVLQSGTPAVQTGIATEQCLADWLVERSGSCCSNEVDICLELE